MRQYKESNYNPEVDPTLHYDKATLDAPKDVEGEMRARLQKSVVYDEQAGARAAAGFPATHTAGFSKDDIEQQRPHNRMIDPRELGSL